MLGRTLLHYEVVERLGAGGQAEVYRARDTKLGRDVAIKILPEPFSADAPRLRRFQREAKLLAALNHPGIATIHGLEEDGGVHFLVMELVEGETLAERIAGQRLASDTVRSLFAQLADAVAAAHDKGVVHRDLKPTNIMVTATDTIKVLDFGLGKELPVELADDSPTLPKETASGGIMGTPGYMSPEQVKGQASDTRSDVFSLGTILYEMATGMRAFDAPTPAEALSAILRDEPAPMSPGPLSPVVARCLAKDATKRYSSARELFEALSTGADARSDVRAIAVLPLVDLKPVAGEEYFADGMTEALITNLTKRGALKVISKTSAMRFRGTEKSSPEIAAELGVELLVSGSVLRVGERVRISAQLINARADEHLWAESYDRDYDDILSLQSEIARTVAGEVTGKLGAAETERKVVREAYEAYLKGRHALGKFTPDGLKNAVSEFQAAIDLDPTYAPAHAGLSEAYLYLGTFGVVSPQESAPRAKAAARKALEIDAEDDEAHTSLGAVVMCYDWEWDAAEREFRHAIDLNPANARLHYWYSLLLGALARHDEAVVEMQLAHELDPLSPVMNSTLGWCYAWAGRLDQAVEQLERTVALEPQFPLGHFWLGHSYELLGRYHDAIDASRKGVAIFASSEVMQFVGRAHALAGKEDDARKVLEELVESPEGYVSPYSFAVIYEALGETEAALDSLERGYEARTWWMTRLIADPRLSKLKDEPRFQALVSDMGLPALSA